MIAPEADLPSGYVDLHCHYVPAIDDGVRTTEQGIELCEALVKIGYGVVAATPHIRAGMFDNDKPGLQQHFTRFCEQAQSQARAPLPRLLLGAEHYCDDHFWNLLGSDGTLPFSGGKALLLELPGDRLPLGLPERCFRMQVQGVRPLIAHPERYAALFGATTPLSRLIDMGVPCQLDLMALEGKYGRRPRRTAERLLEEGAYYVASSDCHRPEDVDTVASAIERLRELAGEELATALLDEHPRGLLRGEMDT